jgi:hypothetical protein
LANTTAATGRNRHDGLAEGPRPGADAVTLRMRNVK